MDVCGIQLSWIEALCFFIFYGFGVWKTLEVSAKFADWLGKKIIAWVERK